MGASADKPRLPPFAWRAVLPALGAVALVLGLTAGRYGYHRDELYFRMLPPAWGYVDQPPLVPWIARTLASIDDSLVVLRLPPLLLVLVTTCVVVALTRELGGTAFAQGIAAWGYAFSTMTLTFGHLLHTTSVDQLVWAVALLATVRALGRVSTCPPPPAGRGRPGLGRGSAWWWLAGAAVGLGTYDKWLVVMLVVGVLAGILVTGPRRALGAPALWGSAALAVLLALPNVVWQVRHGLPQLAMGRALAEDNAAATRIVAGPALGFMVSPVLLVVVVAGVVALLRDPAWRAYRFLPVTLLVVVGLTVLGGAQFYYPFPVLAAVLAAGCVPTARWARTRGRRAAVVALVALHVAASVVINLPVLPLPVLARTPFPSINQTIGDSIGWPTYVAQVDAVADRALATDPRTAVLAGNYGEAGALVRFSRHRDVPVVSGHVALGFLGGPPDGTTTLVVVGDQLVDVVPLFERCTIETRLANGTGVDNEEEGQPVAICVGPKASWATLWPRLRHLG